MKLALPLMAALISLSTATGESAETAASRVLSNGILQVEVMDPNHADRYYRGIRFSPVANVLQVTRDGKTFLHAPVAHNPLTEAAGLPMEFDLRPPIAPPGFAEAAQGEGFVKIGVGVLAKEDDTYRFFTAYKVLQPAVTTVEWSDQRAVFKQVCDGAKGYAYRLESEVRLEEAKLLVVCRLTNTGTKPLVTEQYAHDFFVFDGVPVGRGYEVEFPSAFEARILKPVYEVTGNTVRLTTEITEKMKAADTIATARDEAGFRGALRVKAKGHAITAEVSEPVKSVTVHGSGRYLCPEQFVILSLAPGETKEWTRTYQFQPGTHQS